MTTETIEQKLNRETARIRWHELQTYFASGNILYVDEQLDLIVVGKTIAEDNTIQVKQWMEQHFLASVTDEQAKQWYEDNIEVWAVVIKPLILVQKTKV